MLFRIAEATGTWDVGGMADGMSTSLLFEWSEYLAIRAKEDPGCPLVGGKRKKRG
jgi:hypothetical protein